MKNKEAVICLPLTQKQPNFFLSSKLGNCRAVSSLSFFLGKQFASLMYCWIFIFFPPQLGRRVPEWREQRSRYFGGLPGFCSMLCHVSYWGGLSGEDGGGSWKPCRGAQMFPEQLLTCLSRGSLIKPKTFPSRKVDVGLRLHEWSGLLFSSFEQQVFPPPCLLLQTLFRTTVKFLDHAELKYLKKFY